MNYEQTAQGIYKAIGGRVNIVSAAHCATRLRFVIADNAKCDAKALENVDGVKGVFEASGQLQIIIGTGAVNKVYDHFIAIAGITASSKDEVKQAAASKAPWYKHAIKTLGDIFVPIIPAIVASGLLMGLLEGLGKMFPAMTASGTYTIISLFANAAFVFLPILIAISAAKTFGGNQFLGAVVGMIMIHTNLLSAWSVAGAETIPTASAWFGLIDVPLVGYQGHVIPVIIAVWFMSLLEKKLHKIVPEMLDLFITPLVTVLVTGYCTLTLFGPLFSWIENGVLSGIQLLITLPFGIGAFLAGAVYAPTVVAGVHHMYNAIEAGMLSATGLNTWMPIATAANVAQGGAALALALKTRNPKLKAMALPASLSAFLGITEPAIFGINIRFMKPFIAGCIGGACGALFGAVTHVAATAYGITGLFGLLITTNHMLSYLLLIIIAAGIAFVLSWLLYRDAPDTSASGTPTKEPASSLPENVFSSPMTGECIPLADVPDETFAGEVLGKGIAFVPTEGRAVSPCDGTISTLFETKHAIGITTDDGAELLLHIGLNTVELKGEGFTAHIKEGDTVRRGDLLVSFDLALLTQKGYNLSTPLVVTNTDDYAAVEALVQGTVKTGDAVMKVTRA